MKIRSLVNADYEEWRGLWLSYLNFYETSLADEVINETFYRFIDDHQTKQNALVAEDEIGLVGLVHYIFHPHNWKIEEVCYLQDLFVTPQKRGQKIGQMLIEVFMKKLIVLEHHLSIGLHKNSIGLQENFMIRLLI